jgi:hypothetical protein
MFGNFLRVIRNPQTKSIVKKNLFNFYSQVPKFDPSKDYYQVL